MTPLAKISLGHLASVTVGFTHTGKQYSSKYTLWPKVCGHPNIEYPFPEPWTFNTEFFPVDFGVWLWGLVFIQRFIGVQVAVLCGTLEFYIHH